MKKLEISFNSEYDETKQNDYTVGYYLVVGVGELSRRPAYHVATLFELELGIFVWVTEEGMIVRNVTLISDQPLPAYEI